MLTLILWIFFPLAIQYKRGGWWSPLALLAAILFVMDIAANYTELVIMTWDRPRRGEYTFSNRLYRLQTQAGSMGEFCRWIVGMLNAATPGGLHIQKPKGIACLSH